MNNNSKYKITIDNFEGPLDLLLHLIKEDNIDIYDIKIEDITKQYLDYIESMKELNLSIASEYLVMASELLEMKSRMLLPKKKMEDEEDLYEEDPKDVLIERLLAYKKYKEVTDEFKNLEYTRKLVFEKEPSDLRYYAQDSSNNNEVGLSDLLDAINKLLENKKKELPIATKITKKELSVELKIKKIRDILNVKKKINFEELFDVATKEEVIVNFLSILEMVKKNEIFLSQDNNFKSIVISLKEGD